jgi:hypothetical protein
VTRKKEQEEDEVTSNLTMLNALLVAKAGNPLVYFPKTFGLRRPKLKCEHTL